MEKYNHEENNFEKATGLNQEEINKKLKFIEENNNEKKISVMIQIFEDNFSKKELAYLYLRQFQKSNMKKIENTITELNTLKEILEKISETFRNEY